MAIKSTLASQKLVLCSHSEAGNLPQTALKLHSKSSARPLARRLYFRKSLFPLVWCDAKESCKKNMAAWNPGDKTGDSGFCRSHFFLAVFIHVMHDGLSKIIDSLLTGTICVWKLSCFRAVFCLKFALSSACPSRAMLRQRPRETPEKVENVPLFLWLGLTVH